jgi:hypothetical protein
LELFAEDELFSKKFETGLDVVLWRYISMDLITHDNDTMYYFRDLFENEGGKENVFIKISEKFNKNKIIEEIIRINMK